MTKPRRLPWSWIVVIALALLAIVLGLIGFTKHHQAIGVTPPPWQDAYLTLQLFTLESGAVDPVGPELQIARFLAPLVSAYALLRAILALMSIEAQRAWIWLAGGHVVVCGLGRKGTRLVQQLRAQGEQVIAIESDPSNEEVAHCRELGAVVLIGSASDEWMLKKALVDRARTIVSVTGDDHVNVETAVAVHALNDATPGNSLRCIIHVTDPHLERVLRNHDIHARQNDSFELEFINTYEIAARAMLRDPPLFLTPAAGATAAPHLLIVGLGQLGRTLLWRAARDWRIDCGGGGCKLRVTVIDREAERRRDWLTAKYPNLEEIVELNFLTIDVHSHAFISGEFQCALVGDTSFAAAYICLRDDSLAMYAALNLRRCLSPNTVPIVVSMARRGGMSTLLEGTQSVQPLGNLRVVGLLDAACSWDLLCGGSREVLAQALHQSYLAQRFAAATDAANDPSLSRWDELTEDLRSSNRSQVDQLRRRLERSGFELVPRPEGDVKLIALSEEELDALARAEHERWVTEHRQAGWTPGPTKDRERKISPFLVPWENLSDTDRQYNRELSRSLPSILAKADYAIRRRR